MSNTLKHILVIDDDDDIREVSQMSLETVGGYTITSLNNGKDAISQAPNIKELDAILLDVMMPEMDGPTTLKKLREHSSLDAVPIILMTARVQPLEVKKYLKMGAAGVISKPFDPMNLSNQVLEIYKDFKQKNS